MYSEPGIEPATLAVSGLKSGGPLLDKATIRCIMDGAKQPKILEAGKEILLYREVSIIWIVRVGSFAPPNFTHLSVRYTYKQTGRQTDRQQTERSTD